jgi:hypothetical protein
MTLVFVGFSIALKDKTRQGITAKCPVHATTFWAFNW